MGRSESRDAHLQASGHVDPRVHARNRAVMGGPASTWGIEWSQVSPRARKEQSKRGRSPRVGRRRRKRNVRIHAWTERSRRVYPDAGVRPNVRTLALPLYKVCYLVNVATIINKTPCYYLLVIYAK